MAQLPIYRQQGNITTEPVGQIRDLDTFAQSSIRMQKVGNTIAQLTAEWQKSKDAVENLDGKNKLMSGITSILDEAQNFNDYNTPEELQQKQNELTQRMNELVPNIVSGFSNNQNAREFQSKGEFDTLQNTFKLQEIFRSKYGDMYMANLQDSGDSALRNYTQTGNEAYKQEYFNAIDTGVQAGYLDRSQAEKLKLSTNNWNYDYVYSQILENPYFKASDEVMSKIDPVKQRTLRNFARTEQKRAEAEAKLAATNNYYLNPTSSNLRTLLKTNPGFKGNKNIEGLKDFQPNFNSITTYEGMSDALSAIKELALMPTSTPEEKIKYAAKAAEVGNSINRMQIKDKNLKGDGIISYNDKEKLFNLIYKDMMDDNFRNQIKNMPNLSREWINQYNHEHTYLQDKYNRASQKVQKLKLTPGMSGSEELKKAEAERKQAWQAMNYYSGFITEANHNRAKEAPIGVTKKMAQLQREAAAGMLAAYMKGDVNAANQIKETYGQQMIRLKYWNIPEIQRKNLKPGDKFTVNGKVYSYQGFSKNDIIVEVY